jgi:hypothetical protein
MEDKEKRVGMGRRKGDEKEEDMEEIASTITKALDSEIIYAIGLVNELLKRAEAKICITAEEFLDAVDSEKEKGWIASLGVKGENVIEVKTKTLEPFHPVKSSMEIEATGIFFDTSEREMGFAI